jgi:hypothetical protein
MVLLWLQSPSRPGTPRDRGFTTLRHTALSRAPLNERLARRRELTKHTRSQEADIHAPGGIRTHNPSKRAAADPRLRRCGYCDRHTCMLLMAITD